MSKYITVLLIVIVPWCLVKGGTATWTGLGSDDRWTNPDNWQGGILPTANDDIALIYPGTSSISIDGVARANNFIVNQYGSSPILEHIYVKSGADFVLNNEGINQSIFGDFGTYTQTGGTQVVNGNFSYWSRYGTFTMQGGSITVGGSFALPDSGFADFTGGVTTVGKMSTGYTGCDLHIGANAKLIVCDELSFRRNNGVSGGPRDYTFDSPIYMKGADVVDFRFSSEYGSSDDLLDGIKQMKLVFEGGLDDVSLYTVAGKDKGPIAEGLVNNYAINLLQLGGDDNGYVKLLSSQALTDFRDTLYVDTLILNSGSILDLNGCHLYYNTMINNGGEFLNGTPLAVPEPATLLLLGLGAAVLRRKR